MNWPIASAYKTAFRKKAEISLTIPTPEVAKVDRTMLWFRLSIGFLFLLQFLPYLLLWDQAYIRIHDTLEGELIWYHLLIDQGLLWDFNADATIPSVMNGLPRQLLHSPWSFLPLWLTIFGLYGGYIFNYVLIHAIGFGGMYWLLRRHFLKGAQNEYIALGVALCFSWLPVFSVFGLSVMGQPLVLAAFLNILRKTPTRWDLPILLLFPFYSSIVWAAPAVLGLGGLLGLYYVWQDRNAHLRFWLAIGAMTALYAFANWPLLSTVLQPGDFISQRAEYNFFYNKKQSIGFSLQESFHLFFIGHYHIGTLISLPIIFALIISRLRRRWNHQMRALFAVLVGVCLFYGFYNWIVYFGQDYFSLLTTYKFNRISILAPLLWFMLFAIALARYNGLQKWSMGIILLLVLQLGNGIASNDEFQHNFRALVGKDKKPNFESFFAKPLFDQIDDHIGQPKSDYRVVSLGLHPAIAQYNGFYTLDSHQSLYSLDYKHQFRQAIATELTKNELVKKEFDDFGNRCYLFSAELGKNEGIAFMQGKQAKGSIEQLEINPSVFWEMGGRYLLSAVRIKQAEKNGLAFERTFEHPSAFWCIYLYRIQPDGSSATDNYHEYTFENSPSH